MKTAVSTTVAIVLIVASATWERPAAAEQASDSAPVIITVQTFAIQGPRLGKDGTLIAVDGYYVRDENMEYLYATPTDISLANSQGYTGYVPKIPLLTNAASDRAREAFLQCAENPGSLYTGCPMSVKGTVTECMESSVYGGARKLPCLDVEDLSDEMPVRAPPLIHNSSNPNNVLTGTIFIDGVWKKYVVVNGVVTMPSGADASQYASAIDIDRARKKAIHRCKVHAWANIGTLIEPFLAASNAHDCAQVGDLLAPGAP